MEGSSLAAQLPEDVLLKIYDLLTLQELARLMGICRHWRRAVVHHPKFFGHAMLTDTTPSAVAFFVARIKSSSAKTWDVAVLVHEPFAELETVVFPTVAQRLDDVEMLTINVHASHAPAVFELLRGSAAALRRLHLRFYSSSDEDVVMLPDDILARASPIRTLLIQNVDIPETIPPALASAQQLVFAKWVPQSRTTLRHLARAFPVARDVTLSDRVFEGDVIDPSEWPDHWNDLDFLSLAIGREGLRRALPQLPLSCLAHLSTMRTGQTALECSLSHLEGPFDLHVKNIARDRFAFILTCRSTGKVRSCYELASKWAAPGPAPHRLLSHVAVLDRLLSLTMPDNLWNLLVPYLAACRQLSNVTLVLSSPRWMAEIFPDDWQRTGPLFPNISSLTIASLKGKFTVRPEDIARFIVERLLPQSPLRVRLQGVAWDGPSRILPAIDSVQMIDGKNLYPNTPWHV